MGGQIEIANVSWKGAGSSPHSPVCSTPMAPKRKRAACQRPTSRASSFSDCPACQMKVVSYLINHHLDWDCLALVKNKQPSLIAEAETTGVLCKRPEGISEAKHHAGVAQEFKAGLGDRLHVDKPGAELSDHHHSNNLDAESEEGLVFAPPETNFQYYNCSPEEKLQVVSFQNRTSFKLNAHPSNELGLKIHGGQSDSSPKLQSNTDAHCRKAGKQSCTDFLTSMHASEVKLEDDHFGCNQDIKELISSGYGVMQGEFDSDKGRINSSLEASTSSPKNAKKDGWEFITASLPSKVPKGHYVIENFISEKEEQELMSFLDMDIRNPWKVKTFNGLHLGKAYGLSPDLKNRRICPAAFPMPSILVPTLERMRTTVPVLKDFIPNETNAIDYQKDKGHWLKPHVDDRQLSGTILVNLSLCGDCKMTYERERGPRESYKVLLRRRCIQIQTGECRYSFTHSILNEDLLVPRRVSMTFRQSLIS